MQNCETDKLMEADMRACGYCRNNLRECCIEACRPEAKYRSLVPKPLGEWLRPPKLPPFKDMVEMSPSTRLAILYLVAYYDHNGKE